MPAPKGGVYNIGVIILGLLIMLVGMFVVSMITITVVASFINIVPLVVSLWFIMKATCLEDYIGKKAVVFALLFVAFLTLINLVFGIIFVYDKYLSYGGNLCAHEEQTWFYECVLTISNFSFDDWMGGTIEHLHLGKYQNIMSYTSLLLTFGGNIPTNICIWNAFHLALSAILVVLIGVKLQITDGKKLGVMLFIVLLQPYLDMLFAFHRDGFGEAILLLGFYLFISTYKSSVYSLIAFPIYAFLFWTFRAQYLLIIVLLYLWNIFRNNRNILNFVIGIIAIVAVVYLFLTSINIYDYLKSDMHVYGYEVASERQGRSPLNMIIISILGYFPWTNLFSDRLWPWQFFACIQGAMNLTILFFVFKTYFNKLKSFITEPTLFTAMMFLGASVFVPGHMSYTVVAMPFFALTVTNIRIRQFLGMFGVIIVIVFCASLLYSITELL